MVISASIVILDGLAMLVRGCTYKNVIQILDFPESAPLGRFSHRVAMSLYGSVCGFALLGAVFFFRALSHY